MALPLFMSVTPDLSARRYDSHTRLAHEIRGPACEENFDRPVVIPAKAGIHFAFAIVHSYVKGFLLKGEMPIKQNRRFFIYNTLPIRSYSVAPIMASNTTTSSLLEIRKKGKVF